VDTYNFGQPEDVIPTGSNAATGDLMSNIANGTINNIPSASSQGTTDTRLFNSTDTNWVGYVANWPQKYIQSTDNFDGIYGTQSRTLARYNLLSIDSATAQAILLNAPDPSNPSHITFGLVADTFVPFVNRLDTHTTGVAMQIFQSEVEVYSAIQPNNSALTIDVLTGNIIP